MNPLRFQIIVLRFIALWIRKTTVGQWDADAAVNLLEEVESGIARWGRVTGVQERRTLPAGIQTKHGEAVPFVEDQDGD